ncbi:MAG TPA: tRNA preQ1(34) S-adenosylmethionine ribosyltransferase-isomerase QueA, partial [Glaciecola sp.]|nr:tRNA preQ1(34) S-adenosylmethionine ribosyltransferase-isomerase QueA [Glaciecola sp.]
MKTSDFAFELPEQLIAKYPTEQRTASRLLHLDGVTGALGHHAFTDMLQFVDAGDLLIFNNT